MDLVVTNFGNSNVSVLLGSNGGGFVQSTYAAGSTPRSLSTGDPNNDGHTDLIVANSTGFAVLPGNGAGSFGAPLNTFGGPVPADLDAVDLDHDGQQDVALINANALSLWIFKGKGDGTFIVAPGFEAGSLPIAMVSSDFNNDSKPDLATANFNTNSVSILIGNGDGGFAPRTEFPAGSGPHSIAADDFNADGKIDLIVSNLSSSSISVLLGNGAGGFSAPSTFPLGAEPLAVATGDLNGDAKVDVVAAAYSSGLNPTAISILLGNGAGSFAAPIAMSLGQGGPSSKVLSRDFDGDGKWDIAAAASSYIAIIRGSSTGNFGPATLYQILGTDGNSSSVSGFEAAELNGDSKVDIAVTGGGSVFTILAGHGDGTFTLSDPVTLNVTLETLADLNFDTHVDMVIKRGSLGVLTGDASATFSQVRDFAAGPGVADIVAADFNGDGKLDIAVCDQSANRVFLLINDTPGTPPPTPTPTPSPTPTPTPSPSPIELILEQGGPVADEAVALDAALFLRDPFPIVSGRNFLNTPPDFNTRVVVFVTNLQLLPGELPSSVQIRLVDNDNDTFVIPAEDVRTIPDQSFTQVVFRLTGGISPGVCTITVMAHSQTSNPGTIRIAP